MNNKIFLFMMSVVMGVMSYTTQAEAAPKQWYGRALSHWDRQDFKPYVETYAMTHVPMGAYRQWDYPADMTSFEIVDEWRRVGLMEKFYVDKDLNISILEVGSNFYRLSSSDKRRFLETVDSLYRITSSQQQVLFLQDWNTHKAIGQYTPRGLMLF